MGEGGAPAALTLLTVDCSLEREGIEETSDVVVLLG
jgi:hypothetical protein